MKKFLMVLGCLFAVLIVVAAGGFTYMAVQGSALDEESKSYVDRVTPIILADLSKETLFEYASEELIDSAPPEEFDKLFSWLGKVGEFREYKNSVGESKISVTTKSGKQITAYYEAQVEFETGPATIKVTTVKKGDDWQILGFHINSMALAN